MAVPHYPPPVVGGLERQAHELARGLIARQHNVCALSYVHQASHAANEQFDRVHVYRVSAPRNSWDTAKSTISIAKHLLRLRNRVDVVHVHVSSWFGATVLQLAQLLGKPTLLKLANVGELGIPGMMSSLSGSMRLTILKRASGIVAMNAENLEELSTIGYPPNRILFRPNGIPVTGPLYRQQRTSTSLSAIFVGRLSWEKRLPDLLRAWAQRPTLSQEGRLRIVGEGPERQALENLAQQLGVSKSVQFLGFREDIAELLAASDIFVLPSHIEGNSNAVLEAMRAGLPIVASRLSGTRLQVGEAGSPLLFEVGDVASLSAALEKLAAQPALRETIGNAMRKRVESLFSMEDVTLDYERAFYALRSRAATNLHKVRHIKSLASCA